MIPFNTFLYVLSGIVMVESIWYSFIAGNTFAIVLKIVILAAMVLAAFESSNR